VYICGSYRKIKTGVSLFGPPGITTERKPQVSSSFYNTERAKVNTHKATSN